MVKRAVRVWMIVFLTVVVVLAVRVPGVEGDRERPVSMEWTRYDSNPILTRGAEGEWDSGYVFCGYVLFKDGLYHMFYGGGGGSFGSTETSVGYATSEDGLTWTKYENNPVLKLDPEFARGGVGIAVPHIEGDTWVLYFDYMGYLGAYSKAVVRATAPDPTGPWAIDETPVLEVGTRPDWDRVSFNAVSITQDEAGYVLYYHVFQPIYGFGMATSPDGLTWTKYNDPETTDDRFLNSDPVFVVGESQTWDDSMVIGPLVQHTDHGWEMFYAGSGDFGTTWDIGYATSPDGIHWTRFGDGPIPLSGESTTLMPASWMIVDDVYYLYYEIWNYPEIELGVATGTVIWE